MKCQNKVNEAFVAGVGFDGTPGYRVGYRTSGLVYSSHYMGRFDDGRSDVNIPIRTKELSITVFPANAKTMMVVASDSSVESRVDSRCHVFSHGFLVGNELFRHEMLPYLDAKEFDEQVCRGPAEEFHIYSDNDLRFKTITTRITDQKPSQPESSVEASSRKGIFCFAVMALSKGSHYLVDGNGVSARALQRSLYKMLPPPLCYQLETCSMGEYSRMFDVLFCCDAPYRNEGGYKRMTIEEILDKKGYTAYEMIYPKVFAIMEKEDGMREEYYKYMEEHVPSELLSPDKSILDIFTALERCAREYDIDRQKKAGLNEDFEQEVEFDMPNSDVPIGNTCKKPAPVNESGVMMPAVLKNLEANKPAGGNQSERIPAGGNPSEGIPAGGKLSRGSVPPHQGRTPETTEDENEKLRKKREKVWIKKAERHVPNEKISELVLGYIQTGRLENYRELKHILFGDGVNPELRNVQRTRIRSVLQNKDANSVLSRERRTRYILCIMLSYELSPEEYYQQILRMEGEELKPGPYDYAQALKFIRTYTENPIRNERLLRKMAFF
ncbi:MAG: hypothetical protein Q4A32_06790 [Lachnospiraceae bacterium]|nr:hypothetical protein [Lachnospiraceae bacterium]